MGDKNQETIIRSFNVFNDSSTKLSLLLSDVASCYGRGYESSISNGLSACCSDAGASLNLNWYTSITSLFCYKNFSHLVLHHLERNLSWGKHNSTSCSAASICTGNYNACLTRFLKLDWGSVKLLCIQELEWAFCYEANYLINKFRDDIGHFCSDDQQCHV